MSTERQARGGVHRGWRAKVCVCGLCAFLCGALAPAAQAAQSWASEFQLKAAFIYNVIPFVEWPTSVAGPMVVCFAGDGPVPDDFARFFSGKRAGSQPIEVRSVRSRSELRDCQVALMAYQDAAHTREALRELSGAGVLSVGDGEAFVRAGGVMAFLPAGKTFRLAVNLQAAGRAGLRIRSQLMTIATLLPGGRTEP